MRKLFLLLAAMSCLVMNAWAEDTQTVVSSASFTNWTPPTYGFNASNLATLLNAVVAEEDAVYHLQTHMSNIFVIDEGGIATRVDGVVKDGTYRVNCQIRIDGENAALYRLPKSDEAAMEVTVNGVNWTYSAGYSGPTYSYANISSPNFVVAFKDTDFLYLGGQVSFSNLQKGKAIETKKLEDFVMGGTGTYTFSKKTNHISWLNVSTAGEISGTPDTVCATACYDTISVSDGVATPIDIRVYVSEVTPSPSEREVITSASFTNMPQPKLGDILNAYTDVNQLVAAEGAHYRFGANASWWKYNDDLSKWEQVTSGTAATAGRYRIIAQLRVDDNNGKFYRLPNDTTDFTLTIDGEKCNAASNHIVYDNYSYGLYTTPEVVVNNDPTALINHKSNRNQACKILLGGQLLILRDGHTYNAQGARL